MKPNVDLTENKMFALNQYDGITSAVLKHLEGPFPWNFHSFKAVLDDGDLTNYENELIFTGTKDVIKKKKYYQAANSGNYCECCGADLHTKPWDSQYFLCSRCAARLDEQCNNKLWKTKETHMWNETEDRIVIEMNKRV